MRDDSRPIPYRTGVSPHLHWAFAKTRAPNCAGPNWWDANPRPKLWCSLLHPLLQPPSKHSCRRPRAAPAMLWQLHSSSFLVRASDLLSHQFLLIMQSSLLVISPPHLLPSSFSNPSPIFPLSNTYLKTCLVCTQQQINDSLLARSLNWTFGLINLGIRFRLMLI